MVTCYIAVAYRPLSYAPSSVSVCNTLFWRKKNRPLINLVDTGPSIEHFLWNLVPRGLFFFLQKRVLQTLTDDGAYDKGREPNFIGNVQLMVRCLPNWCCCFFIGNAQQKHEALIKGCLLFLCMQHLLFNWCWWFYLSVHFIQSSLRTVHFKLLFFSVDNFISYIKLYT
jgi:hypothetical protein